MNGVRVLALAVCAAALSAQPPRLTAFVGATVVPMDSPRIIADQVVLVRGERIVQVGPASSVRIPHGARRIDAHGLYLMPGLADMHIHLLEPQAYIPLLLANGVTTVRHMASPPDVRALRTVGPTIYTAGPILDGSPPVWPGSDVVITPDDAQRAVTRQKDARYDFLKVYDNLSPVAYDAIITAARAAHMRVAGHVPPLVGLDRVLAARQWSIEHLTGYLEWLQTPASPFRVVDTSARFTRPAHLQAKRQALVDFVDTSRIPEIARATARAGTWNVPTLVAWRNMAGRSELAAAWQRPAARYATKMLRQWWSSDTDYTDAEVAERRRGDTVRAMLTKALHDAGARLVVGTDSPHPFVVPGFAVHDELQNFVDAGLTPYEALRAATADAAEFMNAAGEFGVVKAGARADLILVEGNPLEDVHNASRIVGVMVRGHWRARSELLAALQ